MKVGWISAALLGVTAVLCGLVQPAHAATKCTMAFKLQGWSAFYETASGSGTIKCNNGQSARVSISTKGGGLVFGKTKVANGVGTFSEVESINELFGSYGQASAEAGLGKSADAQVLTKGYVSVALAGKGQGVDLGFSFGKFTIKKQK